MATRSCSSSTEGIFSFARRPPTFKTGFGATTLPKLLPCGTRRKWRNLSVAFTASSANPACIFPWNKIFDKKRVLTVLLLEFKAAFCDMKPIPRTFPFFSIAFLGTPGDLGLLLRCSAVVGKTTVAEAQSSAMDIAVAGCFFVENTFCKSITRI